MIDAKTVISGYGDIKDIANRDDIFIRIETNDIGEWFYGYVIPSLFLKEKDYKTNSNYQFLPIFHIENKKDILPNFVPLKLVASHIELARYVDINVSARDICSIHGFKEFPSEVKNKFTFTTEEASNLNSMIKDISDLSMVTNIDLDDKHFIIKCTRFNNTRSYSLDINKFTNYIISDIPVNIVPTYISKTLTKSLKNAKIDDIFKYILIDNNSSLKRSFVLVLYFYDANKNKKSVAINIDDYKCFNKKYLDTILGAKNPHILQF